MDKNHFILRTMSDVELLCKPLFQETLIDYFEYVRLYNDGTMFLLVSKPEMINYLEEEDMYVTAEEIKYMQRYNYMTRHLLSPALKEPKYNKLTKELEERYQISHSMIILDKSTQDFYEGIVVSCSSSDHAAAIDFYMNKIMLLENYVELFKENADNLIAKSKYTHNRIVVPGLEGCIANPLSSNKPILKINGVEINLSQREKQCLQKLGNGYTTKQIAKKYNLSPRTIEKYISILKDKLNCSFKSQLVELYTENKIQIENRGKVHE